MERIVWTANRDPRESGLPVTAYTASGDGWMAEVRCAAGSGWEAEVTLTGVTTWRWPFAHSGVTGKSADACKAWVRRAVA